MLTQPQPRARGRWVVAALVVALGIGTDASPAMAQSRVDTPPGGVPGVSVPKLTWGSCPSGGPAQCATVELPLDYRSPRGAKVKVLVGRRPANDPAKKVGTLMVNPGGPGGSGVSFVNSMARKVPVEVLDRYDIVGFEPRGVARNSEVLTCLNPEETRAAFENVKATPTPGAFDQAVRLGERFDKACVERSSRLLPYVGTDHVARDMDVLRAAVGDEKLSYFGYSFGTFIGTVYANLFPKRVKTMVLDGGYNPETYANRPYEYDYNQFIVLEKSLGKFFDWCAAESSCAFGGGKPAETYVKVRDGLDADPVRDADGKVIANGATLAYSLIFALNRGKAGYRSLADALAQAEKRTGPLLSSIGGQASFFAQNASVECADRVFPRSHTELRDRLAKASADAPLLGPAAAYGSPGYDHAHATACIDWPARRASRYAGPWRAEGTAPILLVGTTGDPDTPYQDSVALEKTLANARLLTFVGEGHTGTGRSKCVTAAVSTYLLNNTLPAPNTRCDDEPAP